MKLENLYQKAKDTGGEIIERDDGNYRLSYKTIYDTSQWTLPLEILDIKDSINDDTQKVVIHGIVRKRQDIPKHISRHVSFNSTKAFKRWIADMYRVMIRNGHKVKILEEQAHLPRDTKYRKASGVTYVSGLKCYMCDKDCLQAWTSYEKNLKPTCTKKCMDRGMFHDMQDKHDGKWWNDYGIIQGYKCRKRKDPETGLVVRSTRHKDNFIDYYGRKPKEGYHLHHINMVKTDDDITNIHELHPTEHLRMHGIFNSLCKPLMDMGIVGYKPSKGYYLIKSKEKI